MSEIARKLYYYSDEEKAAARAYFQKTPADIEEDVKIIRECLQKQPHLPQTLSDEMIERFLLRNKFRYEQTKKKIDNYFSLKNLYKEHLNHGDPLSQSMQTVQKTVIWVPMPKLSPQLTRIAVTKVVGNSEDFVYKDLTALLNSYLQIQLGVDYNLGEHLVMDFELFTLGHLKTITPTDMANSYNLFKEMFSARLVGLEFVNPPPFVTAIVTLFKAIFSRKEYEKIGIHQSLESLHKKIPKQCLPKNLGGDLKSLSELHEDVMEMFSKDRDSIMEQLNLRSDETLRIGKFDCGGMFGAEGTFKTIQVD